MNIINVQFADAPTDVLVWLVDHGPTTRANLVREVPPVDATNPSVTVSNALRLLLDCGLIAVPPLVNGEGRWFATPAGIDAVREAHAALATTEARS